MKQPEASALNLMKPTVKFVMVVVTAPNQRVARRLARAALEKRLIACANLVPKVESHYWWRGKIEQSAEVLLVMKTTRARLGALEKLVLAEHPYDTPEFLVFAGDCGECAVFRLDWGIGGGEIVFAWTAFVQPVVAGWGREEGRTSNLEP